MPNEEDTTYLGAQLNSKCDINEDINLQLGATTYMWRKFDKLWKGTNNRIKDKINMYNAVVRSKVAYSLETAPPELWAQKETGRLSTERTMTNHGNPANSYR